MQSTSQAGAPGVQSAQLVQQVGAPLAMGAQAEHEGVHEAVCTQPAFARGALFVTRVPAALKVGAPLVIGAQPALPVWAQSAELASDWDEKDANTLLKLSSRSRFCESAGNKIKEFVADLVGPACVRSPCAPMGLTFYGLARRRVGKESKALSSRRRDNGLSEVYEQCLDALRIV